MPKNRWALLASLAVVLLLTWLPPAMLMLSGWPEPEISPHATPRTGPAQPIAEPPPPAGLSPTLIRWLIVFASLSLGFSLGAWLLTLLFKKESDLTESGPTRPRFYLLGALGLASLAAYAINFLLPFPLWRYYGMKGVSIGPIAERDGNVALATAAVTIALFLLYALAHRLCRGRDDLRLWTVVLVGAVLLAGVNFYVSILTTLDPYDYIARGRITGIHGANPYVLTPEQYPTDPFMEYVSWRSATSAYGPLWETISALIARLGGEHLWPQMLAYKGLALISYLLSTLLIAATLRRVAPQRALAGTVLFAWNPLILMEGVGNAHNDMLMVALLLGAFWALSQARRPEADLAFEERGRFSTFAGLSMVLLAAAILVKFVPILLLPFFLLYLLVQEKKWSGWLTRGLFLLIPMVLLAAEFYLVFWKWPEIAHTFVRRTEMYRMSVVSVAKEALQQRIEPEQVQTIVSGSFLGLFALSYLAVLGRAVWKIGRPGKSLAYPIGLLGGGIGGLAAGMLWCILREEPGKMGGVVASWNGNLVTVLVGFLGALGGAGLGALSVFLTKRWGHARRTPWEALVQSSLVTLLLYILLANFWYWPWYLTWPIALLSLSGEERMIAPLTLAGCAGELAHLGWNFMWYWWGVPSWDTTYQMDALVVLGMVIPALVAYAILSWRRRPAV